MGTIRLFTHCVPQQLIPGKQAVSSLRHVLCGIVHSWRSCDFSCAQVTHSPGFNKRASAILKLVARGLTLRFALTNGPLSAAVDMGKGSTSVISRPGLCPL